MLKKEVKFNNFNGEPDSEVYYFHLSQAELLRMELATKGGLQQALQTMVDAQDGAAIMEFIETFLTKSVGRKSPDGKSFEKSPEILKEFQQSKAYDTLFMELCTNPTHAADFLNGIVPAELAQNVEKLSKLDQVKSRVAKRQGNVVEQPHNANVVPLDPDTEITDPGDNPVQPITLTIAQMKEMDHEELSSGLATGKYVISNE